MDTTSAVLVGGAMLVGLVVALRALAIWSNHSGEILAMKRANAERMANLDGKNPKKGGKKPKNARKDDDEEEDDLDRVLDAVEPYKPFIKGVVAKRGIPLDVDALFDGDELEREKVVAFLEREMNKGGHGQAVAASPYL